MLRPPVDIPESPSSPFPIIIESNIICGYGRGSAELGIPTANVPVNDDINVLDTGIYYGWCQLKPDTYTHLSKLKRSDGNEITFNYGSSLKKEELDVFPMVMSIGWNPFYNNKQKAAEVHIIHKFNDNFYGATIKYVVLGYIRPELNYTTKGKYIL